MFRKSFFIPAIFIISILLLTSIFPKPSHAAPPTPKSADGDYVPDELLVRFRPWVGAQRAAEVQSQHGLEQVRAVPALGIRVMRLPPGLSVEKALERLQNLPEVEHVSPNYIFYALQTPVPTEITDQWGLLKLRAPEAWQQIPPEARVPVLIGVVDTGIDRYHPDLAANIWQNPLDPLDGLDNDGNGKVDDTWGWDLANNDNDPFDDNMHGTAVSSVAAGVLDGQGVAGVCPWCKLAAVKVLGADGSGTLDKVANGIIYAADIGSKVINMSLGATVGGTFLEDAVNYAWNKGAVVIAAAGNNGDDSIFYPASYANAIAVAATGPEDYHSCFSNYGNWVDISAPGEAIYSATPNNGYGKYSGTSLAAPHASGLAALLYSQDPGRTNIFVRQLLENSTEDLGPVGRDPYFGSGRVNALRAVANDTSPTIPPTGFFSDDDEATGFPHQRKLARDAGGALHIVWHTSEAGQYKVLYSTSNDDGLTWSVPELVFASSAETYHPSLAVDHDYVYIAFPSKHGGMAYYTTFFTRKPLAGGSWSAAAALMGGSYHAIRPDLFVDPSNGRLHLAASSFDNQPYVYYRASSDQGQTWGDLRSINFPSNTQYADVHAYGEHVYLAVRTLELWFGIIPIFHLYTMRSLDGGSTWSDRIELANYMALLSGAYGLSLAGSGDRLYLAYEHAGGIYFRQSQAGLNWSAEVNLGSGVWPTISQEADGRAWVLWETNKEIFRRAFNGAVWGPQELLSKGSTYPNLKLGASGGLVEWAMTACNGAPFRIAYGGFPAEPGGPTPTPTFTSTPSLTLTPSATATATPSPTSSPTATFTFTSSPTVTPTATFTATPSPTNSPTATFTYTPSPTNSPTATFTYTPSPTSTLTPSPTSSLTATFTFTPSPTSTSTATFTPTPSLTATPAPLRVHIGDLDGTATLLSNGWNASVTITVHNAAHSPVAGAKVSGTWSGGYSGKVSCTTGSSGQCSVKTGTISNKKTSVNFTVTNVAVSSYTYYSMDNHDPDGDSNGTTITIRKP